jgi:thiosulfate dehydrogenase (quinone) large subunit
MAASRNATYIESPPIIRFLFSDTRVAWLWLVVRIYLGYQWIEASLHKIFNPDWTLNPGWMSTGASLKGFWVNAVVFQNGKGPISYDWYRDFLNALLASNSHVWFAQLIALGEFAIGLGLIVGAFVGLAAFFGAFMNMNFMLAGSASTNPVLFTIAILIIAAWKTAGFWGVDRFLQPLLKTLWSRVSRTGGGAVPATEPSTS